MQVNLEIGPSQFDLVMEDSEKGFRRQIESLHGAMTEVEKGALQHVFSQAESQDVINEFWKTVMYEFTPMLAEMLDQVKKKQVERPENPDQAVRELFRVVVLKRIGWKPDQPLS